MQERTGYFFVCSNCSQKKRIPVNRRQQRKILKGLAEGVSIQDAVPELEPKWREVFLTGICPECWEVLFSE